MMEARDVFSDHPELLTMFNRITGGAKFAFIQCLKTTIYGNCVFVESLIKFAPESASSKIRQASKDCLTFHLYIFNFNLRLEPAESRLSVDKIENISETSFEVISKKYRFCVDGDRVGFNNFCLHRFEDLVDSNLSLGPATLIDGHPSS